MCYCFKCIKTDLLKMDSLTFEIVQPENSKGKWIKGKARPIVLKKGYAFSPKSLFEKQVKAYAVAHKPPKWDKQGIFAVEISCYFAFLKKDTKDFITQNSGNWYQKKPDLDNIAKGVLDSLNGIVWADDNAVCSLKIDKFYNCFKGEKEKIIIKVKRLDNTAKM